MAKGDVTYMLTNFSVNRIGATVDFTGNVSKYVEDEDGTKQSIGSWVGSVSYPKAGISSVTLGAVNSDLIAAVKAKNASVSGKTIT